MRPSLAVVAFAFLAAGCSRDAWQRSPGPDDLIAAVPWFSTMRRSIAIRPYEMPRDPAPGTVPTTGIEPGLPFSPQDLPEIDRLRNPVARTSESINRGADRYAIYCAVCHGEGGAGDGPVAVSLGGTVRNLLGDDVRRFSDGRIYTAIRHGFGLMPGYGHVLTIEDRWNVVNYVRVLQGASR